jgi:hypothetical protein
MSRAATETEDPLKKVQESRQEIGAPFLQMQQEAYDRAQANEEVVSSEMRFSFGVAALAIILLIGVATALGASWAFAPVYLASLLTFVAGALYLIKKLMRI